MAKMRWYAGRGKHYYSPMGHHFVRLEDGTEIDVHSDVYEAQFQAYLERIGIRRTSWYEIMERARQQAEQEWRAYCQIMDAFDEDVEQWRDYHGRGVVIEQANVPEPTGKP